MIKYKGKESINPAEHRIGCENTKGMLMGFSYHIFHNTHNPLPPFYKKLNNCITLEVWKVQICFVY